MKKIYISPEAIIVKLDTECVIALSKGDKRPENDDPNNQFSNEYRTSIWGD